MLTRLLAAVLAAEIAVFCAIVSASQEPPRHPREILPVSDVPLLSDAQRNELRETGRVALRVGGTLVVIEEGAKEALCEYAEESACI